MDDIRLRKVYVDQRDIGLRLPTSVARILYVALFTSRLARIGSPSDRRPECPALRVVLLVTASSGRVHPPNVGSVSLGVGLGMSKWASTTPPML